MQDVLGFLKRAMEERHHASLESKASKQKGSKRSESK